MTKFEAIADIEKSPIKLSLLAILKRLKSKNDEEVKLAFQDYAKLVEQFYVENQHLMAPQQYKAALEDMEYFAVLIELADHY